jgi:hypothetical protein
MPGKSTKKASDAVRKAAVEEFLMKAHSAATSSEKVKAAVESAEKEMEKLGKTKAETHAAISKAVGSAKYKPHFVSDAVDDSKGRGDSAEKQSDIARKLTNGSVFPSAKKYVGGRHTRKASKSSRKTRRA